MPEVLICQYCENEFTRPHSRGRKPRFCSEEHRRLNKKDRDTDANAVSKNLDESVVNFDLQEVRTTLLASRELGGIARALHEGVNASRLIEAANPAMNLLRASTGLDRLATAASGVVTAALKGYEPITAINPLVGQFQTHLDNLTWTPAVITTVPAGIDVSRILDAANSRVGQFRTPIPNLIGVSNAMSVVPAGINVSQLQWVVSPAIRAFTERFAAASLVGPRFMSALTELVDLPNLMGEVVANTNFLGWDSLDHAIDVDDLLGSDVSQQVIDEIERQLREPSDELEARFGDVVGESATWTRSDVIAGVTALTISILIYYVLLPLAMVLFVIAQDAAISAAMIFQMVATLNQHSLLGTDMSFLGEIALVDGAARWVVKNQKNKDPFD